MIIRRVEIRGFKSFADRTVLRLDRGLTAIVGPNGTGKSNLVEAIRWALGEQSTKAIRGVRMDDVIFAGTASRKPVSLAEVTVVLDNSDNSLPLGLSEVSISRRVDRAGIGEYLINGTPCRLRDVQMLLAGTGLGKDSCALVAQGKLEEPIACGPEGRRFLLEEASGLSRYRLRRKESLRCLEDASSCLEKLQAALRELGLQEDHLRGEAVRLEAYESLSRQAEEIQIELEIEEYRDAMEDLTKKKAELETAASARLRIERCLGRLKLRERGLEERVAVVSSCTDQAQAQRESAVARVAGLRVQAQSLKDEFKRINHEASASSAVLAEKQHTIENVRRELRCGSWAQDADLREMMEAASAFEEASQEREFLTRRIAIAKEALGRRLRLEEARSRARAKVFAVARQIRARLDELEGKITNVEASGSSLALEVRRTRRELAAALSARDRAARLTDLAKRREDLLSRYRQTEAFLEVLREHDAFYEGYDRSVRNFMSALAKAPELAPGVEGTVGELLTPADGFEAAVEAALGSAVGHVVVRDESWAMRAIEYLKRFRLGRVTFLPLNIVGRSAGWGHPGLAHPAILGVASDFVSCRPEHRGIVAALLGRTVVARDLEGAIEAARALRFGVKVVSLEGDVVWPGGAISGGSHPVRSRERLDPHRTRDGMASAGSPVGRRERIRSLEKSLNSLRDQLRAVEDEMGELAGREFVTGGRRQAQDSVLSVVQRDMERWEAAAQRLREVLQGRIARLRDLGLRRKEMADEARGLKRRLELAERGLLRLQRSADGGDDASGGMAQRMEADLQQVEALESSLAVLASRLDALSQRSAVRGEALERTEAALDLLLRETAAAREKLYELLRRKAEVAGDLSSTEARLREAVSCLREQDVRLGAMVDELARLRQAQARCRVAGEKLQAALREKDGDIERLAARASEASGRAKELLSRMRSESIRRFQSAQIGGRPPEWREQARRRMEELKAELGALGPVNFRARADLARIAQRRKDLEAQVDDVIRAQNLIREMIACLDREADRAFMAAFSAARAGFKRVFRELFGQGEADLMLVPARPEASGAEVDEAPGPGGWGVDITVAPPGRKTKDISALSGGERALVALAFTFALLHLGGTRPFVVLDEVEASLDEVNLQRFVAFLRARSTVSQFLIVTHNRLTMEACDLLYGVTMEEPGVSKVVSLRLDEIDRWQAQRQ